MSKNKKFTSVIISLVLAVVLAVSAFAVNAANIQPSKSSIALKENENAAVFSVTIESNKDFAGAEFGVKPAAGNIKFNSIEWTDGFKNGKKVDTEKNGVEYFAFFSNGNNYKANTKYTVASLTYDYSGDKEAQVKLDSSKVVWLNEQGNIESDTSSKDFTVKVSRVKTHQHEYTGTSVTPATLKADGAVYKVCRSGDSKVKTATIYRPAQFKLSKTAYTYNKKSHLPKVTVKDSKGNTISANNYSVKYSSKGKKIGIYTVTITFKGNYSGQTALTYKVTPKKTKVKKLASGKKSVNVTLKRQKKQVTGYQIQYSTSKKMKNAKKVSVKPNKKTTKTIKNLKSKKTYYVRARTYKTVKIGNKNVKVYSSWSKAKKVKVK